MKDKNFEPKHTISILVENKAGVLARISGLFSARGFNIDSLAVGETDDPTVSRMTIVVKGDEKILEQVEKQLNKLVDVIKLGDYIEIPHLERDLALIKVKADKNDRSELLQIVDIFRAKIVDVADHSVIIEVTGDEDKIEALIRMLGSFGILEMSRTGIVAMARGNNSLTI
ncbi:MAG: acetolactate synthase small subunit [Elusimicrobia bacterium RIFCSPLOWO2_02_FULL_39_32]|nr:MAG: acetolactate synthase small subunit [Elusimicrobia bacterium RIFCSPHIGHO2_02_FULL_39_36]OGR92658.1 MAG: acetolactate synthase small subunit [Elusimicrobia bacterium RIFCSPLOWO2_02_FULL_39_32]OGR99305.1 MAG: acetolactate synthase small subunit [Elusimicrobia bacterium RIFCSPLOWO2_12_FULL_39_28]